VCGVVGFWRGEFSKSIRDSTPGMTEGQMRVTMYANMDDSAKDSGWVHSEDEEYKRQNGGRQPRLEIWDTVEN
jgi:hypothetical protein